MRIIKMNEIDRILDGLFRNTVGFDTLNHSLALSNDKFPPYNIVKSQTNPDDYSVEVALAGYSPEEINVVEENRRLVISRREDSRLDDKNYVHRGIARRNFTLEFTLGEYVKVEDANFENGMLNVNLKKHVPDEMKPKRIEIKRSDNLLEHTQ
jgi:molecular chaperone IbpA